jgi:hypothetical protein
MKLRFNSKKYFPNYFIADVVIYATVVWWVSRLFSGE